MRESQNPTLSYGRFRAYQIPDSQLAVWPQQLKPKTPWKSNLVTYEWGAILARALAFGERMYRISALYLEFENVASPGDPVTVPTYDRTRSQQYYQELGDSGNRDFLRVPITSPQILSSDDELYPKGNQVQFFARSQGLAGIHGLEFSYSANSVVFGAALVAIRDQNDPTQDLVLSVGYLDPSEQQPKLATSQVGYEWVFALE